MASIDPQIDAAVPLMKARAAQFDDRSMDEYEGAPWHDVAQEFIVRAIINLQDAQDIICELTDPDGDILAADKRKELLGFLLDDLCDAPNLCALALSLLPEATDV